MSAEGRVEIQKLNQTAALLSFGWVFGFQLDLLEKNLVSLAGLTFREFQVVGPKRKNSHPRAKEISQWRWPTLWKKKIIFGRLEKKKKPTDFVGWPIVFCWLKLWKSYSLHRFLGDYFGSFVFLSYYLTSLKKKSHRNLLANRIFFCWLNLTFSQKSALKKKQPTEGQRGQLRENPMRGPFVWTRALSILVQNNSALRLGYFRRG